MVATTSILSVIALVAGNSLLVMCTTSLLRRAIDTGAAAIRLPGLRRAAAGTNGTWTKPWFCHGIDCPEFTVVPDDGAAYEERKYPAAYYATTVVKGMGYDKATSAGFMRLFHYISGENEGSEKVPMTAPVTEVITPGAGPFCEDHFNISFFVPYDFQGKAPPPTSADVYIEKRADMHVYVTSYPGFSDITKVRAAATELGEALAKDGKKFDTEHIWFAGYDSPFRLFGRHNEVWLVAADAGEMETTIEYV